MINVYAECIVLERQNFAKIFQLLECAIEHTCWIIIMKSPKFDPSKLPAAIYCTIMAYMCVLQSSSLPFIPKSSQYAFKLGTSCWTVDFIMPHKLNLILKERSMKEKRESSRL